MGAASCSPGPRRSRATSARDRHRRRPLSGTRAVMFRAALPGIIRCGLANRVVIAWNSRTRRLVDRSGMHILRSRAAMILKSKMGPGVELVAMPAEVEPWSGGAVVRLSDTGQVLPGITRAARTFLGLGRPR